MNGLVRTIALDVFRILNTAHTSCMSPFPVVFTLWYSRVHVHSVHCGNETIYIETPINNGLGFGAVLHIPYVDPYNGYV